MKWFIIVTLAFSDGPPVQQVVETPPYIETFDDCVIMGKVYERRLETSMKVKHQLTSFITTQCILR